MTSPIISIFGNKIFSEILHEIKLFTDFKIKYYEDLDLCLKDSERQNLLTVFFDSRPLGYISFCVGKYKASQLTVPSFSISFFSSVG